MLYYKTQREVKGKMKFCTSCRKELMDTAVFCGGCGLKQEAVVEETTYQSEQNHNTYFDSDIAKYLNRTDSNDAEKNSGRKKFSRKEAAFVSVNSKYYMRAFNSVKENSLNISWNWAAFWLSPYWFFYRKMYKIGSILLGANIFISIFFMYSAPALAFMIFAAIWAAEGMFSNYLYMRYVQEEISIAQSMDSYQREQHFKQKGGTNVGVAIGVLAVYFIIAMIIM
jgi:hypothetical protein